MKEMTNAFRSLKTINVEGEFAAATICIDSSGQHVATAGTNGALKMTLRKEGADHESVMFETLHVKGTIPRLAFAPARLHPCMVASAGSDGLVSIIAVSSKSPPTAVAYQLKQDGPISAVAFSENGVLGFRSDNAIHLYQCDSTIELLISDQPAEWLKVAQIQVDDGDGLSFAPGGLLFVASGCIVQCLKGQWQWVLLAKFNGPFDRSSDSDSGNDNDEQYSKIRCVHWGSSGFIVVARENSFVEIWRLTRGKLGRIWQVKTDFPMSEIEWNRAGNAIAGIDTHGTSYFIGRTFENNELKWECQKC